MNKHHPTTALLGRGADSKRKRLAEEEAQAGATAFQSYGILLETVMSFKYLRFPLIVADNDWPAVIVNLQKARKIWS